MQDASESRDDCVASLSWNPTVRMSVSPVLDFNVEGSAKARVPLATTIKENAGGDTGVMMWKHGEGSYTQGAPAQSWRDVEM